MISIRWHVLSLVVLMIFTIVRTTQSFTYITINNGVSMKSWGVGTRCDNSHLNSNPPRRSTIRASASGSISLALHTNKNDDDYSDDPKYLYYRPQSRASPQGGQWAYTEPNVRRSAQTFLDIRKIGGVDCTNDVYVRSKSKNSNVNANANASGNRFQYWYIGKMARTDGTVSLEKSVAVIWNMIEEHACRLRPVELGREFGTGNLEVWVANGDTELEMSQAVAGGAGAGATGSGYGLEGLKQMQDTNLKRMDSQVADCEGVKVLEVGLMAEIVTNTGKGFYIVRDDLGRIMQ